MTGSFLLHLPSRVSVLIDGEIPSEQNNSTRLCLCLLVRLRLWQNQTASTSIYYYSQHLAIWGAGLSIITRKGAGRVEGVGVVVYRQKEGKAGEATAISWPSAVSGLKRVIDAVLVPMPPPPSTAYHHHLYRLTQMQPQPALPRCYDILSFQYYYVTLINIYFHKLYMQIIKSIQCNITFS